MEQKFPLNHFLKLDDLSSGQRPHIAKSSVPDFNETQDAKSGFSKIIEIHPEFSVDELKSITDALLEDIKNKVSLNKFQAYFANAFTVSSIRENFIEVIVTTSFIKTIIEKYYLGIISDSFIQILGKKYQITINALNFNTSQNSLEKSHITPNPENKKKNEVAKSHSFFIQELIPTKNDLLNAVDSKVIEHREEVNFTGIDLNKTFNNFIIGPSNNIAHALAMSVAKDPGKTYSALYIYGNSGLGKTHLIHAIANFIQSTKPGLRICLTSADKFMNDMVECIKKNQSFEFKKQYTENVDVLIVDDIHELKNKVTTQEMFFHIFNELVSKGKQLVFTSDKTPKEIVGIEDRIRTRLSNALPVEIQQPDLETRIAILKKKAVEKDIYLSEDVVNLIAKCVKNNIRELEGCLIKLGAITSILKVDIDLEVAREHLNLHEELEYQKNISIDIIGRLVSNYYKIPIGDIRGKARTKEVVLARQVCMYLISKLLKNTLKDNGQYFSGRDHSTVLHAIKSISDRIKVDHSLSQQILDLENQL